MGLVKQIGATEQNLLKLFEWIIQTEQSSELKPYLTSAKQHEDKIIY